MNEKFNNNYALHNQSNSSIVGILTTTETNSSSDPTYVGIPYTTGTGTFGLSPLYPKDPIPYDFTSIVGNVKKDAITELIDQINSIKNIEYRMISLIKTIENSDHFRELLYKNLNIDLIKKTLNLYSDDEILLKKI